MDLPSIWQTLQAIDVWISWMCQIMLVWTGCARWFELVAHVTVWTGCACNSLNWLHKLVWTGWIGCACCFELVANVGLNWLRTLVWTGCTKEEICCCQQA
jgi:hypothetical protein